MTETFSSKYDISRLKNCMERAKRGERLTLGFFGGSITQGSLSSSPKTCYAYRVFCWWKEAFSRARFYYVNAGIGGTDSHYGVSRVAGDLLMYQPDFVIVDFSVNDSRNPLCQETYEGLIRKMLSWPSHPAVLLLNNVYYDSGVNAQDIHNAVGDWYKIPHVSIKDTVYQRMKAGEFTVGELSPDGLHPNDKGHELVAGEIIKLLEKVKTSVENDEKAGCAEITENAKNEKNADNAGKGTSGVSLPAPLTQNAYENALRLDISRINPLLNGFFTDPREKEGHLDHFKNGWIGEKEGDEIVFEIEATCIAIQYRKTIKKPARRAQLILDGNEENKILLDANFAEDWGDKLELEVVLNHGEKKKHQLKIRILPEKDEGREMTPFYLMALIIA